MRSLVSAEPDRLSALDAAFLDLETDRAPLHVGWTMRFAGTAPSLAALRRHSDGRLHTRPRFRRRVVEPALGRGDPHWADDAGFDVARHVHALRLAGRHVTLDVDGDHLDAVVRDLSALGLRSLTSHPPTLEELFLRHYVTDTSDATDPSPPRGGADRLAVTGTE